MVQGECRDRVFHQAARTHDRLTLGVNLDRLGEQHVEVEVDVLHHHQGHERGARQQQNRLDDLHPGGRQHATEQHVQAHQDPYQDHRHMVVQAEQQLDQLASTDHLRDQVERHHHQRPKVYLPRLRRRSAIRNRMIGQPTRKPME